MSARCVALFSGGLDSMLAVRIMQQQGIELEALNFRTIFSCCQDESSQAARELDVSLTVIGQDDDYLDLVKRPRFGYGRAANPCVDCRIYMFEHAWRFARQIGATFVISGEIVGQRPMSQKRRDLDVISNKSGLEDRLLRPLSAKILPITWPEREGLVDRSRLYAFQGRNRKGLIQLARSFGLTNIPSPSTGCALTEKGFGRKVFDLIQLDPGSARWDFEILRFGRHYRFDPATKIVVGRNADDNASLKYLHSLPESHSSALLEPDNFGGPVGLVIGKSTDRVIDFAAALVLRFAKRYDPDNARIQVHQGKQVHISCFRTTEEAQRVATIAT